VTIHLPAPLVSPPLLVWLSLLFALAYRVPSRCSVFSLCCNWFVVAHSCPPHIHTHLFPMSRVCCLSFFPFVSQSFRNALAVNAFLSSIRSLADLNRFRFLGIVNRNSSAMDERPRRFRRASLPCNFGHLTGYKTSLSKCAEVLTRMPTLRWMIQTASFSGRSRSLWPSSSSFGKGPNPHFQFALRCAAYRSNAVVATLFFLVRSFAAVSSR
jgi:hypothetical protein